MKRAFAAPLGLLLAILLILPGSARAASPCAWMLDSNYPTSLFAGAQFERMRFIGSSCKEVGKLKPGEAFELKNGSTVLVAEVASADETSVEFTLQNLPSSLSSGAWELWKSGSTAAVASVPLQVLTAPISVTQDGGNPALDVHYSINDGNDGPSPPDLDQWHDQRGVAGVAVVTPPGEESLYQWIGNAATLAPTSELERLAEKFALGRAKFNPTGSATTARSDTKALRRGSGGSLTADEAECQPQTTCPNLERKIEDCAPATLSAEEDELVERCRTATRPWRVKMITWADDAQLYERPWWYREKPVRLETLGQVAFAAFKPQSGSFRVEVSLVDPATDEQYFVIDLEIAKGARRESLPLPLSRALYVTCGELRSSPALFEPLVPAAAPALDVITNGSTRAVNDDDLQTGSCRLHYSRALLLHALKLPNSTLGLDALKYYGAQSIELTLTQPDGSDQKTTKTIDPNVDSVIYLPAPTSKKSNGIYRIAARPYAPLPPAVIYRPGAPTTTPTGGAAAADDFEFRANLRPRGPFGWQRAPLRVFATIPVNFVGIRFPAAPRDLRSSSSLTAAQVTPIQTGVLVAVEPWNYDTGHNAWVIPTRFVTGMHLLDLSHGEFAASWVTGASVTLPLIDLQKGEAEDQLSTDLALGLFWEVDLREPKPFKYGQHALVTLGLNVLSLFGSK